MPTNDLHSVFISYRREPASFIARAIFQDLLGRGYDVFMDVERLDSGQFDTSLLRQIAARAHFVLILTPGTLERCQNEGDWVRRELEEAIRLKRNIVPLYVNQFSTSDIRHYLPPALANEVGRFNGVNVPHDYFEAAMEKLATRFLTETAAQQVLLTPMQAQPALQAQLVAAVTKTLPVPSDLRAEDYFSRAMQLQNEGRLDEAIKAFSEAIRVKADYVDAYNCRGLARQDQGNLTGAIEDYDHAIALKPDFAMFYFNRGHARYAAGDALEAIRDYDYAIHLAPNFAIAWHSRGLARQAQGDLAGAIQDYDYAIHLNPDFAEAYGNRGNARYGSGDLAGAIQDYDRAIRLSPDVPNHYWSLGVIFDNNNQLAEALRHYEQYLALGGSSDVVRKRVQELKQKVGSRTQDM